MPEGVSGMNWIIVLGLIALGTVLTILRTAMGPTAPDRVVAVDSMTTITTALLVLLGLLMDRYIYLDISLVYAALAFIATLAIARYLEGGV